MDDVSQYVSQLLAWFQGWRGLASALKALEPSAITLAWMATAGALFALLLAWGASRRARAAERMLRHLQRGTHPAAGTDRPSDLDDVWERAEELQQAIQQLHERTEALADQLSRCVRRVSLVRFNAFEHTSGEQSFSLALLDQRGDGAVMTALVGREDVRIYAKPITAGSSTYPLSDEEREAVRRALSVSDGMGPVQRPGKGWAPRAL